jgi:hypothetical protein
MNIEHLIHRIGAKRGRGIVLAVGGAADMVIAKSVATGLVSRGCGQVDLAQPLNCSRLSDKDLLGAKGAGYALASERDLDHELVLRHHGCVAAADHPLDRRGKGLAISSSLEWSNGTRYVCAGAGDGPAALARRMKDTAPYYDFAIGVDGGGDVLTHGEHEFDRIVLANFKSGWQADRPLLLVTMGLGADGGSEPKAFDGPVLPGWVPFATCEADHAFVASLQEDLERLLLWHPAPATWSPTDPCWGYGLKVPQIIALAARGEFLFGTDDCDADLTRFPRRGELKTMHKKLLREVRLLASEENR